MTIPRDAIGLSERLREPNRAFAKENKGCVDLGRFIFWLKDRCKEAATQLDALSTENARLKLRLDNLVSVVSGIESALDCTPDSVAIFDAIEQLKQDRDALQERVKELEAEREKLKLHIQSFVENVQYHDSYGVPGSEFMACLCCRGGGAPGVELVHESHCPVERSLYTYQDWCDEQREFERESRENAARATRAEQERDEALERLKPFARAFELNDCDNREDDDALEVSIKDLRAASDCVLRLASGPDKEKRE